MFRSLNGSNSIHSSSICSSSFLILPTRSSTCHLVIHIMVADLSFCLRVDNTCVYHSRTLFLYVGELASSAFFTTSSTIRTFAHFHVATHPTDVATNFHPISFSHSCACACLNATFPNIASCLSDVTYLLALFENSLARSGEYDASMNCILGLIPIARAGNICDTSADFHVLGGIVMIRFFVFPIITSSNALHISSWNGFTAKLPNGSNIRWA